MAKSRQKDFAKVKLKVGRKLKPANATSTEFKTKKVVVRATPGLVSDPVHCLTACASASSSIKLMHLSKLLAGHLLASPHRITGDLLNALARLTLDSDDKVRRQARRCIEQSLNCMHKNQLSLHNSVPLLLTHVKCGLTHLNPAIASESRKLLSFLITRSSPDQEQHFMQIVRSRFWDGKSVTLPDLEMAADIVMEFHQNAAQECQQAIIQWSPSNNHIPWSRLHRTVLSESSDITFSASLPQNGDGKDLQILLANVTSEGLSQFLKRTGDSVSLNLEQGRRLVALLKLSRCLLGRRLRSFSVPDYEVTGDSSRKKACSALNRQITELIR